MRKTFDIHFIRTILIPGKSYMMKGENDESKYCFVGWNIGDFILPRG